MAYCVKCGSKNDDDAEFCKKCGTSLKELKKDHNKDDDCVCSGNNKNPLTPIFWGIVVILIGLWIIITYIIPAQYVPLGFRDFSFGGLIILIIAVAIILTGFRILTKNK